VDATASPVACPAGTHQDIRGMDSCKNVSSKFSSSMKVKT